MNLKYIDILLINLINFSQLRWKLNKNQTFEGFVLDLIWFIFDFIFLYLFFYINFIFILFYFIFLYIIYFIFLYLFYINFKYEIST